MQIYGRISIHAPREGGDSTTEFTLLYMLIFQSTPPARGATLESTHRSSGIGNFNPRPPRGGRRVGVGLGWYPGYFNPRPPRGGRRGGNGRNLRPHNFNPRPPRGGRHMRSGFFYE